MAGLFGRTGVIVPEELLFVFWGLGSPVLAVGEFGYWISGTPYYWIYPN